MSINYDLNDLVNNMIELEITGAAFYSGQAGSRQQPLLVALFQDLAEQEKKHQAVYEQLRDNIAGEAPLDDDSSAYLRDIIERKFHLDPSAAAQCETAAAVIDLAMRLEQDSILFVETFGKMTGERHAAMVGRIKGQEEQHLRRLTELKAALAGN
ncbi:ferritin-like domain-containing protein [Oligosphaera ethanolica]|jgi:rubrerythrin|uniref:Rubrerythrin n=1 Tax=Oligosphaera ethanolica TaxID=760260 RepID=A0AAE3VEJ3_9BACT|nr:ferritin family protein [Oligosphaera ethanolica]MDQ0288848.1 rubrerythrin [Oligosphaera ethanolica]NLE56165.1 ferritin family protein [Lentisphaerota bacterium]